MAIKFFLGIFWGKSSGHLKKRAFQDVQRPVVEPLPGRPVSPDEHSLFWLLAGRALGGSHTPTYRWLKTHQHQGRKDKDKELRGGTVKQASLLPIQPSGPKDPVL